MAEVPALKGCFWHKGDFSRSEELQTATKLWIATIHQRGQPLPNPNQAIEPVERLRR